MSLVVAFSKLVDENRVLGRHLCSYIPEIHIRFNEYLFRAIDFDGVF